MNSSMQNSSHSALAGEDSVATSMSDVVLLIGRILLGWIFRAQRIRKTLRYPGLCRDTPGRAGCPAFLAYISVPAEFFGGLAIMFGFATRYAAVVMTIFMLVATFSSHRYWDCHRSCCAAGPGWKFLQEHGDAGRHLLLVRLRRGAPEHRCLAEQTEVGPGLHKQQTSTALACGLVRLAFCPSRGTR